MAMAQPAGSARSMPGALATRSGGSSRRKTHTARGNHVGALGPSIRVGKHGELHTVPTIAWVASFGLCTLGDVMLGRWVLLPLFLVSFYGGTFIIALVTYPRLYFWRRWLRRRGLMAWYLIEVAGFWGGTTLVLFLLSPWWLSWSWSGTSSLQVLGWVLFVGSVVAGTWAVAKMGWARLLLAGALFPPGAGAEENGVPQWLVVEGPYRYVRNPLYDGDFCLIVGAALLTQSWALMLLAALYLVQLALQPPPGRTRAQGTFRHSIPPLLRASAPLRTEAQAGTPARPS